MFHLCLESPFNLKLHMYVLVNRCLTHRVSPLVRSLLIDRSLGPLTGALTRATFVLLRTFSRYGYHLCYFRMHNAGLQRFTCCRQGLVFGKMLSFTFKNQTVEKWSTVLNQNNRTLTQKEVKSIVQKACEWCVCVGVFASLRAMITWTTWRAERKEAP